MTAKKNEARSEKTPKKRSTVKALAKAASASTGTSTSAEMEISSEEEVRQKAYALWESRGRPLGSPEVDWFNAQQ